MAMTFSDFQEYQKFTKPAELHKAVNTLRGLVAYPPTAAPVPRKWQS